MRGRLIAVVGFLAACLLAGSAWSQTRGLTIKLKASEAAGEADAGAVVRLTLRGDRLTLVEGNKKQISFRRMR